MNAVKRTEAMLDEKGRCCGRKPLVYKSKNSTPERRPQRYCQRCDRAYELEENEQIPNWAWKRQGDSVWERRENKPLQPQKRA